MARYSPGLRWRYYKHLVSFVKADNSLVYEFENSTYLTLTLDPESKTIMYSYRTADVMTIKKMDDNIITPFYI